MNNIPAESKTLRARLIFPELKTGLILVLTNKYLYFSIIILLSGSQLNFASQTYLHNYMSSGKTLPMLSDLILDHLPMIDLSFFYDIFSLLSTAVIIIYVIHKNEYKRIPFILVVLGIFLLVRGVFIILTPFGNPPLFDGSKTPFNGFSKFELGVYPSGHVGNAYLFMLLSRDKVYKWIQFACLMVIILALFISHGHYSIDILSGLFFAYAIRSFGNKYLTAFDLGSNNHSYQT